MVRAKAQRWVGGVYDLNPKLLKGSLYQAGFIFADSKYSKAVSTAFRGQTALPFLKYRIKLRKLLANRLLLRPLAD